MQGIEPTLVIQDVMRIFHVSQPTVYRWIAEARAGKSRFPLPINGTDGRKRKLLWNHNDILVFQHANNSQPLTIESATQRQKRHSAAMERLRSMGVNMVSKQNKNK
jgi:predicted DNA-binding transcriptional regulator AlpA